MEQVHAAPACYWHGFLVIDKPRGMTSRDVVNRAVGWFPRRTKVGHTGTLDPLATGVLVLAIGQGTRLVEYVQRMAKTYHAVVRLGARSDTDDAEGTITPVVVEQPPDREAIELTLSSFIGTIEQVPPAFSAAKVTGRRAYDLARRGEEVDLQARPVQIHGIDLIAYDYPLLTIEVRCGKGTYIRSLARDLGDQLGCGGYIETLRRTHLGSFTCTDALNLDAEVETVRSRLLPLDAALADLPHVALAAEEVQRLRHGQPVNLESGNLNEGAEVAVLDESQYLIAVGRVVAGKLQPVKVL